MFEMIRLSGQGIAGYVTDSVTGDPLWARVTVIEKDWPIFTDINLGDYHRYVLSGTYSISVSAPGYREKTVSNITTYADTFTQVDIALSPMDTSYAFKVVICNVPNYYDQNHTVTPHALGDTDGNYLSLGVSYQYGQRDGWIIFDMGPETPVFNKSGYDFGVVEGNDGTTEACSVFVGEYPTWSGPWFFVGMVTGSQEIDISSSGLGQARYVMLVDDGNGSYSGATPGYDLDAIINYGQSSGVVEELPLFPEIGNVEINSLSSLRNNGAVLMISGVNENNPGRVLIFDITGRKLYDSQVVRSGRFAWNGYDNRNVTVSTGNYFAVLRTEAGNSFCKFTIIK